MIGIGVGGVVVLAGIGGVFYKKNMDRTAAEQAWVNENTKIFLETGGKKTRRRKHNRNQKRPTRKQ